MHKDPPALRRARSFINDDKADDDHRGVASIKHARYFAEGVPYHIICKTQESHHLMRPDRGLELRSLTAGVIGRALRNSPRSGSMLPPSSPRISTSSPVAPQSK